MQPGQPSSSQPITIYKAPQKGKGQKLLEQEFQAADFPYNPPYFDGNCYFAGPNDRSIALCTAKWVRKVSSSALPMSFGCCLL
jgi:hypothetical protein